jgi:polar amino acid transport system substrate-binding protein
MARSVRTMALVLALTAGGTPAAAQSLPVVTFATDSEKTGGFLLELTVEAMKRSGYDADVLFVPWARAVYLAQYGRVDALLGCYWSAERAEKLAYTTVLAESPMTLFALEGAGVQYRGLADLRGLVVGTINGAAYPRDFLDAVVQREAVASYEQNIQKLLAGRIDVFIEKALVVSAYLDALDRPSGRRIVPLDPPVAINKYYNAFSKAVADGERKRAAFDAGLNLLRTDGTYALILKKGKHE